MSNALYHDNKNELTHVSFDGKREISMRLWFRTIDSVFGIKSDKI